MDILKNATIDSKIQERLQLTFLTFFSVNAISGIQRIEENDNERVKIDEIIPIRH